MPPACRILAIGGPMSAEEAFAYASTVLAMACAGRLGGFALGVFTLSHALSNITGAPCTTFRPQPCPCCNPKPRHQFPTHAGIALLNGLTGAIDTFSSQAHGSRSFPAIGTCRR